MSASPLKADVAASAANFRYGPEADVRKGHTAAQMRWIVGGKAPQGRAASPSQMGRYSHVIRALLSGVGLIALLVAVALK
jgi:hypothetical protein